MMLLSLSQQQALPKWQKLIGTDQILRRLFGMNASLSLSAPTWLTALWRSCGLLMRRRRNATSLATLHAKIVAQVREPSFYRDFAVPDSFDGRFDLLVIHAGFLVRALSCAPHPCPDIASDVMSYVMAGLDADLREMGVGDVSMPKKIKPMIEAFYGRMKTYSDALQDDDAKILAKALMRNVYAIAGEQEQNPESARFTKALALADYVRALIAQFDAIAPASLHEEIFTKEALFPNPLAYRPKE